MPRILPRLKKRSIHNSSRGLLKRDPTRTLSLRKAFRAELRKRFNRLKGIAVKLLLDDKWLNGAVANLSSTQIELQQVRSHVGKIQRTLDSQDVIKLEESPHITVRYGLTTEDPADVKRMYLSDVPISVKLGSLTLFRNADADVLKVDARSKQLESLHKRLGLLPNVQTHSTYHPHLTIAYLKPGTGIKYTGKSGMEGVELTFDQLTFSDSERNHTPISLNVFCATGPGGGIDATCPLHVSPTALREAIEKCKGDVCQVGVEIAKAYSTSESDYADIWAGAQDVFDQETMEGQPYTLKSDRIGAYSSKLLDYYAKGRHRGTSVDNVFCPTGPGGGVDPTCSPSGGSKSISFGGNKVNRGSDEELDKVTAVSFDLFKRDLTDNEISNISGAPHGAMVSVSGWVQKGGDYKHLDISWSHPEYGTALRSIVAVKQRDGSQKLLMNNGGFKLNPDSQGSGHGTEIFAKQVETAEKLGIDHITTIAERDESKNGYYTWARLGYDAQVPWNLWSSVPKELNVPRYSPRISQLMMTKEGREWWKQNGETEELTFDLKPDSLSRRVLNEYVTAKRQQQGRTAPSTNRRGRELTGLYLGQDRAGTINVFCATGEGGVDNAKQDSIDRKVGKFRKEFEKRVKSTVNDKPWWESFIKAGFNKGAARAFDDVKKPGLLPKDAHEFHRGSRRQFLQRATTASKVSINKLHRRVEQDLDNIIEAMSTDLENSLRDALSSGQNINRIAKIITERIEKIGITRAELVAKTRTVEAHSEGQLAAFEEMGISNIGIEVEWTTAGNPCPLCAAMSGVVLKPEDAHGLIPRHPNCMCAFEIAEQDDGDSDQVRDYSGIRKAVRQSLKAERRKGESLKDRIEETEWEGADIVNTAPELSEFSRFMSNAFCPTGKGGGQDNSCSPKSGGKGNTQLAYPQLAIGDIPAPIGQFSKYLEANGQQWKSKALPKGIQVGTPKECFRNASMLMMYNKEYDYAEGIAYPSGLSGDMAGIGFLHAWCVDKAGNVIDNTWENPAGSKYFGVRYSRKDYMKHISKTGMYGVFGGDDKVARRVLKKGGL